MAIIPKQNAILIYKDIEEGTIMICEEGGYFNEHNGEAENTCVTIGIAHIETLIAALVAAKQEIIDMREEHDLPI